MILYTCSTEVRGATKGREKKKYDAVTTSHNNNSSAVTRWNGDERKHVTRR